MTDTASVRTRRCPFCGREGQILNVPIQGYYNWVKGALIQTALPTLTNEEREQLMTGIHPNCWSDSIPPDTDFPRPGL